MPNRLSKETSPYLLQHQNNPVDWYPWGEEALDLAVEKNKPILLSIGYSSCHWCHVMEHESFENPEIANLMNTNFICIKVDREERPDLDQIYQNVAQALTGGGGWPLTVFLTPARKPFFGGTYFPPEDRYGRAGLKRVLVSLAKAYMTDPIGVAQNAMKLSAYIQAAEQVSSDEGSPRPPEWEDLEQAAEALLAHVDWQNGGIGDAPKFPNPMTWTFLWRIGQERKKSGACEAVLLTLRKMAQGGIYDQLGGGFSRYSVDATWSVPHFEKMLYDNGLLLKLYSEILLTGGTRVSPEDRSLFLEVISGTVNYLLREMRSSEGGFFAAQDADSEGVEGKFFAWDLNDLEQALDDERERRVFSTFFGVNESGNFEHGKTVLFQATTLEAAAAALSLNQEQVSSILARAKNRAFAFRSRRRAPLTDTKVLASWNGLVISGLCWASQVLEREGLVELGAQAREAATAAFRLVAEKMTSGQGAQLFSTFQQGEPKHNGYLDDYAFMAVAALDLARVTPDSSVLSQSLKMSRLWVKRVIRHFGDKKGLGYFFTSDDHEELIERPKTVFDQAIPAGVAMVLQALAALSEVEEFDEKGEKTVEEFSKELELQLFRLVPFSLKSPMGCSELLNAAILFKKSPIVISGPGTEGVAMRPDAFRKSRSPHQKEALLLCHRRTCEAPYRSIEDLKNALSQR